MNRTRQMLVVGLAALLTSTYASGADDSDALRRLQEENAALRKRLAELEAKSTPATESPATETPAPAQVKAAPKPKAAPLQTDEDVMALSPFEVREDKDYGYLKTNAVTATRIGMEIQKVPMNISVMSEDFIKDTGVQTITDILRYTSSGSPDSRFAMRIPGNSATPQGNFTLRGFTVNSLMRNGVFRYVSYNLDNVDRVEIVKGPAAVFFGQGYPGGVINYVTKRPQFERQFSTFTYAIDNEGGEKVTIDHNTPLSDKAAFRTVGAWTDLNGDRRAEFRKNFNFTPSLTLVPFKSGKVKINLEFEYLKESFNLNDSAWIYPQGWFDAYANPPANLIAASGVANATAYKARIWNNMTNYFIDLRKATNDPSLPIYTKGVVQPYAYVTDLKGNRYVDKKFNYTNAGAKSMNEVKTFQTTVDASPLSWVDARYTFTKDASNFDNFSGLNVPNADGITWTANSGGNGAGYYRSSTDHQLDVILKANFLGTKNKLLLGGLYSRPFQQYMASAGAVYYSVPGYNYPTPPANNLPNGAASSNSQVPVNQVLYDRAGNVLTAQQVYSSWDPAMYVNPPVSKIYNINRNLMDGYKSRLTAYYANWQTSMLKDDRLTLLGGYRREASKGYGQSLVANDPWFAPPESAYLDPVTYPPGVYNYSISYAGDPEGFRTRKGDSWMGGASFAITPSVSVYASVSKTFKINTGLAGGFDELSLDQLLTDALANNGGKFTYRGTTFTDVKGGREALEAAGAFKSIPNEDGKNYEIGVKTSLWNQKLVTTVSLFRGVRKNQKLDDSQRQAASDEPFNYSTTTFAPTSTFYGSSKRNFRWRSVGVKNQITGTDFDIIWTPVRNYQVVVNGAWLWQAETLDNPTYYKPGTTAFTAATAANQALYTLYYNNRIENVPEYRLNVFNKYTFNRGLVRGLSIALGGRYSSETIVGRNLDWNPDRGGFTAGNYIVYDATIAYPWEVLGYKLSTSLSIQNLTDKIYYEGSYAPGDSRTWTFRTSVSF